jgi:hypothetical protein
MLPSSMEEQSVEEFIQKFEQELVHFGFTIQNTMKAKQHMVRTTTNKKTGRNVYLVSTLAIGPANAVANVSRYLKLAKGTIVNSLILKDDSKAPLEV